MPPENISMKRVLCTRHVPGWVHRNWESDGEPVFFYRETKKREALRAHDEKGSRALPRNRSPSEGALVFATYIACIASCSNVDTTSKTKSASFATASAQLGILGCCRLFPNVGVPLLLLMSVQYIVSQFVSPHETKLKTGQG